MSEVDLDARRKGPAPILGPVERAEVLERYRKGATTDHLAESFGVSRATIDRALGDEPRRPTGPKPNTTLGRQVADLRERGMTFGQIAAELRIPRSSAMYHLRKLHGVSDTK